MKPLAILSVVLALSACSGPRVAEAPAPALPAPPPAPPPLAALTKESASNFAQLTLKCVQKQYPNSPGLVMNGPADVQSPEKAHPAFYGCYDWHSSVHGHWMLTRLLRLFPDLPEAPQIKKALDANLSAANIKIEAAYFAKPGTQAFERTYGWAWTLKLAQELHASSSPEAKKWEQNIQPLADMIAQRYIDFLPKQVYPIRTGLHPNTAFGLAFAMDYALAVVNVPLREMVSKRAQEYFGLDKEYPAKLEPGGSDFLSPALAEADLMRRVLPPAQFVEWFHKFLPSLDRGEPWNLMDIPIVSDRSDPQLGHLDGLNLSRAWCMLNIAKALPANDPWRAWLADAGFRHATDALQHVATGHYEGEHWLGSFAVFLLTENR